MPKGSEAAEAEKPEVSDNLTQAKPRWKGEPPQIRKNTDGGSTKPYIRLTSNRSVVQGTGGARWSNKPPLPLRPGEVAFPFVQKPSAQALIPKQRPPTDYCCPRSASLSVLGLAKGEPWLAHLRDVKPCVRSSPGQAPAREKQRRRRAGLNNERVRVHTFQPADGQGKPRVTIESSGEEEQGGRVTVKRRDRVSSVGSHDVCHKEKNKPVCSGGGSSSSCAQSMEAVRGL